MKKTIYLIITIISSIIFAGCGVTTSKITKGEYYPKIYKAKPKSILVLPARNTTTSVDATNHFRYTISQPLSEKGYYVFPVHLVDAFFKSENLTDSEQIRQIPIKKLKEIFNPDAILYVDINAWDTGYTVFTSNVDVGLTFSLIETKTEEEIWQNNAYAYSYEGISGDGGILGLVIEAIATAINTATDYTKLSYVANLQGTRDLPNGKYHSRYAIDIEDNLQYLDFATLKDGKLFVNPYFIHGNKKEGNIPLTVRGHVKGYHAFPVNNLNNFNHNGYGNYYITQSIKGQKYLRNRFFKYENNKPYLLSNSKKVFVFVETDGKIPFSEENGDYYFQIDEIVELKITDPKK